MKQCHECSGFVPSAALEVCPHCDVSLAPQPKKGSPFRRMGWKKKLVAAAGTGAMMFTLMACYGGPPQAMCDTVDKDGDGYVTCKVEQPGQFLSNMDCNDNDKNINPAASDSTKDGVDQNCDGIDGQ